MRRSIFFVRALIICTIFFLVSCSKDVNTPGNSDPGSGERIIEGPIFRDDSLLFKERYVYSANLLTEIYDENSSGQVTSRIVFDYLAGNPRGFHFYEVKDNGAYVLLYSMDIKSVQGDRPNDIWQISYDDTGAVTDTTRSFFQYSGTNLISMEDSYYSNGVFVVFKRSEFKYNGSNRLIQRKMTNLSSGYISNTIYTWDGSTLVEKVSSNEGAGGNPASEKATYQYENGRLVSEFIFSDENGNWAKYAQNVYSYNAAGNIANITYDRTFQGIPQPTETYTYTYEPGTGNYRELVKIFNPDYSIEMMGRPVPRK